MSAHGTFAGRALSVLAVLAWAASLGSVAQAQAPRVVVDARGRAVEIKDVSRIVTIGGAVSEIVFALGYGENVVGVDQTSTFPAAARNKPNVGYMRALSAEGVISLAPSLIIATEGSGPPDVIEVFANAAVPFLIVPEGYDEAAVLRKARMIAQAIGEERRGMELLAAITEDFTRVRTMRGRIERPRKATFVLAVGGGTPTVGGAGTSADGIFALSGIENAMKGVAGYKPAVAESSLAAAPDVIVTMLERSHGLGPEVLFALPAFAGTPAAREKRLVSIPSYALTFGPRAAHAARDLAAAVYPELQFPELARRAWTEDAGGEGP
jgi:iron complex transport system substrate-binding protein